MNVELTTTRMVAGGDALGRAADGRVVLVDGALPDERVRIEVLADRADHVRGRVLEVLHASPARIEPPCPHARAGCGGCGWQHVALERQRAFKRDIITDALHRIAHIDDAPLEPTVELPPDGYRTTVRALVVNGRPALRQHHAHIPIAIEHCMVAHPLVDDVLHNGRFGEADEITVRASATTGERCVIVDPPSAAISVPADVQIGASSAIHEVVDGVRFRIAAPSFFQTRTDGAAALAGLVRAAVGPNRVVADLYCGVGLFAALLDAPRRVVAVERGRAAAADARHNLRDLPVRVIRADVATWRPVEVEVVVADPSRSGLGRAAARKVLGCEPERIVLVSCDAASLARDVALLRDGGYEVQSITPVDLFPHTPHVECVTAMERSVL